MSLVYLGAMMFAVGLFGIGYPRTGSVAALATLAAMMMHAMWRGG